ncbi:venom protease-like isoform X4 [Aphis craccivora]|uniref:Venom protease-like isoform X4 n=1 Tax=Aphis craccivora TaxID=307492 RepID=A0A6G0Y2G7_APHCR|nr:venom protease-like isoform X4 [Aphis craccivora]
MKNNHLFKIILCNIILILFYVFNTSSQLVVKNLGLDKVDKHFSFLIGIFNPLIGLYLDLRIVSVSTAPITTIKEIAKVLFMLSRISTILMCIF